MARSRNEKPQGWMMDLADKHGIDIETVQEFYLNLIPNRNIGTLKDRTIDFFDLYFEGIKEGTND